MNSAKHGDGFLQTVEDGFLQMIEDDGRELAFVPTTEAEMEAVGHALRGEDEDE